MRIRLNSSSKIGFVLSILFNLIFLLIGAGVLVYGIMQYLEGAPLSETAVFWGVGGVFMLVGLGSIWRTWRRRKQSEDVDDLREKHADALWKVRPAWRSATIQEDTSTSWSLIIFAVLWNGFSWPLAGYVMYDIFVQSANPQWGGLFVLIFPAAGILLGWMAAKRVLHRRKFGQSTLEMDTMPGRLGRRLQARVQTGVAPDDAPEDGFHVLLTCYRRTVRYTRDSDGDRKKEVEKDILWRDEKRMRGRSYGSGDRVEVPVSFELPTDQPTSTPEKRERRIMWEIEIEADLPGLDYDTSFEIPVFGPEDGVAGSATDSESDLEQEEPRAVSEDAETDEVFWSLDEEGDDTLKRAAEDETSAADASDSYEEYEVGGQFTEPVSDGISMERGAGGGLKFHFAAARNKGMALLLTVLGVGLLIGGFFVFGQSFFAGLIMLGMGGLISYGAWQQWTNASTVVVKNGQVRVESGSFGSGSTTTFPCAHLAEVRVEANGRMGDSALYDLNLYRMDAEARQQAAEGAEKMGGVVDFLQSTGLVGGGADSEEVQQKIRAHVEKHGTQVKVAGGLTNKQEADWVAAKIEKAADREAQFA